MVPLHPSEDIALWPQRGLVGSVEQQERLGLDAHRAPSQWASVPELRAVAVGVFAFDHVPELVGAQRNQDYRVLGRIEIAEAKGEAEAAPGARRVERERASIVGAVGLRVVLPRLARVGVLAIEIELSSGKLAGRVVPGGVAVGHERRLVGRPRPRVIRLLQVELDGAGARHPELLEEGRREETLFVGVPVVDDLESGIDRDAPHELRVVVLADSTAAVVVARVAEQPTHGGQRLRRAIVVLRALAGQRKEAAPLTVRSVCVPPNRVEVRPAVVVVPAERDDALLLDVPLDPDEIAGLEDLVLGRLQDAIARIRALDDLGYVGVSL